MDCMGESVWGTYVIKRGGFYGCVLYIHMHVLALFHLLWVSLLPYNLSSFLILYVGLNIEGISSLPLYIRASFGYYFICCGSVYFLVITVSSFCTLHIEDLIQREFYHCIYIYMYILALHSYIYLHVLILFHFLWLSLLSYNTVFSVLTLRVGFNIVGISSLHLYIYILSLQFIYIHASVGSYFTCCGSLYFLINTVVFPYSS